MYSAHTSYLCLPGRKEPFVWEQQLLPPKQAQAPCCRAPCHVQERFGTKWSLPAPLSAILTLTALCREHGLALQGLEHVARDGDQSQPGDVPLTQPPELGKAQLAWPKVLQALQPRTALGSLPAGLPWIWGPAARLGAVPRTHGCGGARAQHPSGGIRHFCPRVLWWFVLQGV